MAINPETIMAAMTAAQTAEHLGSKYLPQGKNVINNVFGTKTRNSAKTYLKGLTTMQGVKKLVSKDLPKVAKKGVKLLKSGNIMKKATEIAGDIGTAASAIEGVVGENKYTQGLKQGTQKALETVQTHHDNMNTFVNDLDPRLTHRD